MGQRCVRGPQWYNVKGLIGYLTWTISLSLFSSRPTAVSDSAPDEEKLRQDEGSFQAPSPLVHGRISSDDSETEGLEEPPAEFPSSSAHPRPVAVSISFFFFVLTKQNFVSSQKLYYLRSVWHIEGGSDAFGSKSIQCFWNMQKKIPIRDLNMVE